MMGSIRDPKLLLWVSLIFSLVCISIAFDPVDNYLIDCGSSIKTTVGNRVFAADNSVPPTLSTPQTILASISSNSIPSSDDESALYQTARILTGSSTYAFPIQKQGRHWIRLHFFPFNFQNFNLKTARFGVSANKVILLENFQVPNDTSVMLKEYSVNITSNSLVLAFTPSNNSFAFINAIEVVSVPDELISDVARTVNPVGNYQGLSNFALETVYRVNMGSPRVSPSNDTLSRTWVPDLPFLLNRRLANFVNFSGSINYVTGGPTRDIAPDVVYSTGTEMNPANVSSMNFNVTWEFSLDTNFMYLIRMHFCDIISRATNELYFNVYINSWLALRDLDLTSLTVNALASPYYQDFVVGVGDQSSKLRVSIGPSTVNPNDPNAILNGLEIMKMNNSIGSLDGLVPLTPISQAGSKKNIGVIVGSVVGVFVAVILVVVLFLLCRRRKLQRKTSKTWVPFSTSGGNSYSMGSKFSNGTTNSTLSGFRFSFVALQEATNGFDENWVIGVGGFGKVYKGVLRDGTKVAVKRVLCARPVIDPSLPREMVNIAEWAMKWQQKGQLEQIIDPRLVGQINSDSLRKFGDTIEKCLADYGVDRPTMGDVLWNLEYALQLQESVLQNDLDVDSMKQISNLSPLLNNVDCLDSVTVERHEMSSVEDLSGVSMSRVFSQLVKAEGR
ncbi:hypothetical protein MRB53_011223 [Persea americana]|uniref:Uncharacterized protein n=1 Tax=Persea americana TaxID=3435 RepID=A0ACC2LTY5_PERAE|nr:hypothetical protein MRB53_011223 [Persea americana]